MNELFTLLKDVMKDHIGLFAILLLCMFLIMNLDKINNFLNRFTPPSLPPFIQLDGSTYALQKLREYELGKAFEARGMPYIESKELERIHCLHDLLDDKISIPQICRAHNYIKLNESNTYYVSIPKIEYIGCIFFSIIIIAMLFIWMLFITHVNNSAVKTINDYATIVSSGAFVFNFSYLYIISYRPFFAANKVEKLIKDKTYVFKEK